ncbi:hypothetical protein [Verminephrobacter eiseniae]|uniref:hypothetical protein n=1 Tax=Verminephrobacter eiseniae TaxID=364317 RepID=UPI0022370277|nr:hypothetical protein [Verminephrobacter eiseniae]
MSKIKPDQASQQTVRGFAAADEGRQRRMGHRAALAAAAAAPIGQGRKQGPNLLGKTRRTQWFSLASEGAGDRSPPFSFFTAKTSHRRRCGQIGSGWPARPDGYNAAAGFFAARPGFLLVVGGRPCKTIGGAAKALGCKRRRAPAATYQPTLKKGYGKPLKAGRQQAS